MDCLKSSPLQVLFFKTVPVQPGAVFFCLRAKIIAINDLCHLRTILSLIFLCSKSYTMKKLFALVPFILILFACGGSKAPEAGANPYSTEETTSTGNPKYDPNRGAGKWTPENVALGATIDAAMVESAEKIRAVKCSSCHKLTEEKLVGPGWKGVTNRRKPEWIMNFITNPDPMIEKDPVVQAELELCLVRMPNQNLSDTEARAILELMRKNDGVQ